MILRSSVRPVFPLFQPVHLAIGASPAKIIHLNRTSFAAELPPGLGQGNDMIISTVGFRSQSNEHRYLIRPCTPFP